MTKKEFDAIKDGDTIEFYNPITGSRFQRVFDGSKMYKIYGKRETVFGGRFTSGGIVPTIETKTTTTGILFNSLYPLKFLKLIKQD